MTERRSDHEIAQQRIRQVLRRLADFHPGQALVLSVYLDWRPQATGELPALRSGEILLKDRLREIEKTLLPRGPALDSFHADAERINAYLEEEAPAQAQGLACFACAGQGLFETVEAGVPFDNQVSATPLPDLFQVARLLDEHETAVVAVVDSNTARLFVRHTGFLEEVGGPDDANVHYRKRAMGGLNQARYQRHIDKHRADFAQQAATAIEHLVQQTGATRLILAGDEVAIPLLRPALSPVLAPLVQEEILRLPIRAPKEEVMAEIEPLLTQAEAEESHAVADQLISAVQAGGLGLAGVEQTRQALEQWQAEVLVLETGALDEPTRSMLVRQATQTGADVELVDQHERLHALGGVGALLRYRPGVTLAEGMGA